MAEKLHHTELRIIEEGREARRNGVSKSNNPWRYSGRSLSDLWERGWLEEENVIRPPLNITGTEKE